MDFRDAAFELAKQNREKKQAFFAQNSPFVQCFMGDFYFLRQSGPEILPPGRKNPGPEKEIPGPEILFSSPEFFSRPRFFSDGGLEALFPATWNFFTDKSPMSICRHKPRPAYVPRQSRRGNIPHPRHKESLRPLFADIWISAHSARLRFLRPPPPPAPYK